MRVPKFTAEASLGTSRGYYQAQISVGSVTPGSVQAQHGVGCWCSEPDYKKVCTKEGDCEMVKICHQWTCPPKPPNTIYWNR